MNKRSIITVAVGKPYYLNLALNLARSFLLWHKNSELEFLLLTDNPGYFKTFLNQPKVKVKALNVSEAEKSFTSKFLLIDHIEAEQNLFIDCDCLIYQPLDSVFDQMDLYDFTAIGKKQTEGTFFCDIRAIIKRFGIKALPTFVGSVYFFKNNNTARAIFAKAIELKAKYDELGFVRLRDKENEEPLFALAMALNNQDPIADNYKVKADLMYYTKWRTNVLKGEVNLYKQESQEPAHHRPAIVHFNDKFSEGYQYLIDELRLANPNQNSLVSTMKGRFAYQFPQQLLNLVKVLLRQLYHQLLGPSAVKKNKRTA
jgi:hypothetical protein